MGEEWRACDAVYLPVQEGDNVSLYQFSSLALSIAMLLEHWQ